MSIPENKHTSSASVLDLVTTFCFVDLHMVVMMPLLPFKHGPYMTLALDRSNGVIVALMTDGDPNDHLYKCHANNISEMVKKLYKQELLKMYSEGSVYNIWSSKQELKRLFDCTIQ